MTKFTRTHSEQATTQTHQGISIVSASATADYLVEHCLSTKAEPEKRISYFNSLSRYPKKVISEWAPMETYADRDS